MNNQAAFSNKPSSAFVGASWAALLLGGKVEAHQFMARLGLVQGNVNGQGTGAGGVVKRESGHGYG